MPGLPFVDSKVAYVNGAYVPVEQATISVFDRGFLYGDGIYETPLGMPGEPVALREPSQVRR